MEDTVGKLSELIDIQRYSDSEIITPTHIVKDMIDQIIYLKINYMA